MLDDARFCYLTELRTQDEKIRVTDEHLRLTKEQLVHTHQELNVLRKNQHEQNSLENRLNMVTAELNKIQSINETLKNDLSQHQRTSNSSSIESPSLLSHSKMDIDEFTGIDLQTSKEKIMNSSICISLLNQELKQKQTEAFIKSGIYQKLISLCSNNIPLTSSISQ